MTRIALSAGHWPQARGACSGGICEHEQAAHWCALIAQHLQDTIEVFHVPTGPLPEKVANINAKNCDLAVELHFNACGGCGAEGAETLYYPGSSKGKAAAGYLQRAMVKCGVRSRGIKEGWYKQDYPGRVDYHGDIDGDEHPDYFLKATNCTALVLEPEFIDNHWKFDQLRKCMTHGIAGGILAYLKEITDEL